MKWSALSLSLDPSSLRDSDPEITAVVDDSRFLVAGCLFVAIRGTKIDGHNYLAEAVDRQVAALVVEDVTNIPDHFRGPVVKVSSTRRALSKLAATWNAYPAQELEMIGVTGTNGKTTTTHFVEGFLQAAGRSTGVIGTINHHLKDRVWETKHTSPDPLTLQGRLREMRALGARAVAMEVSSHALDQSRVADIDWNCGIFTNLTRDHLDYHGTMDNYFRAKEKLFTEGLAESRKSARSMILNGDDSWAQRILPRTGVRCLRWSLAESVGPEIMHVRILARSFQGTRFMLEGPDWPATELSLPIVGDHNVENATAALLAAWSLGVNPSNLCQSIEKLSGVRGRLEAVPNRRGINVFIDYAHTDDALRRALSILQTIRAGMAHEAKSLPQIITVFGCGGDRDRGKRPLMMKAALENSDWVVVTSDNPRSEAPGAIIDEIIAQTDARILRDNVRICPDRRDAIERSIELARPGDILLIAGKGHEVTQEIHGVKHPFDDFQIALENLL